MNWMSLAAALASALMSSSAWALDLSDQTPCSAVVSALDTSNKSDIHDFVVYVDNQMDALDTAHTSQGEPGIMAQLSDKGRTQLDIVVAKECRDHPLETVYNAAAKIYVGTRDLETMFGTAK